MSTTGGPTRKVVLARSRPQPRKPAPSTAFGALGNTLAQTSRPARKAAARRERQAANRLPSRPSLPIIPKLKSYSPAQRQEIARRVAPVVLKAVVHEGHAQSYANDAAHHERQGGSHEQASTPFARLLRNSNAQERQTLHVFEGLGGAHAVNAAVEGARRQTIKAQLGTVLAGKAPKSLASDLEARGYLRRDHVLGSGSLPEVGPYITTDKAAMVGQRPGAAHFSVDKIGAGTQFLRLPKLGAIASHVAGGHGGGVQELLGNAGADLSLGPTMAAGTLVQAAQHPRKVAGETAQAIGQTFAHPVKSFKEHPVWTLQTFEGGRAALGRGVGALTRAATKGRVGSEVRAPVSLVGDQGTRLVYNRRYSKDIMRQGAQRATDRLLKPVLADPQGLRQEAADLRSRAQDAAPDHAVSLRRRAVTLEHRATKAEQGQQVHATVTEHGRELPVMRASTLRPVTRPSRLLKKRSDFEASRATSLQHGAVAHELEMARRALPTREHGGGKIGQRLGQAIDRSRPAQPANALQARLPQRFFRPEQDLVSMAVEKTLRSPETFREDLLKERARVESEYKGLKSPRMRSANRLRARTIDRALRDPKALRNAAGVFKSAHAFAERINELQAQGVELHQIPLEAAHRAKLFPYAMSHMGAYHGTDPALDAYIAQATSDVRSVQARRNFHASSDAERQALDEQMARIRAGRDQAHAQNAEALRGPHGRILSNEEIHAHMIDPATGPVVDPASVAYVPHRLDLKSASAYYQQALRRRPSSSDAKRTGAAYKAGATSPTMGNLAESVIRQAGSITNVRAFDRFVHDAGIRQADGSYFTMAEAEHEVQRRSVDSHNIHVPGEPDLVPVRVFKAKLGPEERARVREMQDPRAGAGVETVLEPWQRRLDTTDRTSRNVVLMPKPLVDRIDEHLQRSSPGAKVGQGATNLFRQTVLPFSSKWLVGNVAEAVLRLGAVGATVLPGDRNIAAGRMVIQHLLKGDVSGLEGQIGKQAAREIVDHLLGGQLYGNRQLRVHRSGQEIAGDLGQAVSQTPVIHELAAGYRGLTGHIFRLNKALEQRSQVAALGKFARRDIQGFTGSWAKSVRLQHEAVAEAARGLTDTAKQHEAARFIDETLGQYSRFSPTVRHFIQNAAPFLPWYLNSVRFVFWTLPAHHPIKSALLVNAEKAFSQDWQDQHKDLPPGSLRQATPTKGGGWRDYARFTPWGGPGPVLAGDNSSLVSPLYPQFQGAANALQGRDPFGRTLQGPRTPGNPKGNVGPGGERVAALNSIIEAMVPGVQLARRAREHGETAYSTSTVLSPQTKKGTSHNMSPLRRIFDPVRPTYLRKKAAVAPTATAPVRPARQTAAQHDADLIRKAVHGPTGGTVSSDDLDLIRKAMSGR